MGKNFNKDMNRFWTQVTLTYVAIKALKVQRLTCLSVKSRIQCLLGEIANTIKGGGRIRFSHQGGSIMLPLAKMLKNAFLNDVENYFEVKI